MEEVFSKHLTTQPGISFRELAGPTTFPEVLPEVIPAPARPAERPFTPERREPAPAKQPNPFEPPAWAEPGQEPKPKA